MRFVVITGTSGAGKTLALHSFEDAGYYAVDNLPPRLLPALAAFYQTEGRERGAVVVDTRSGPAFAELPDVLKELQDSGLCVETLFLDASDEALVQRYKETRRPHLLLSEANGDLAEGGILDAIHAERDLLSAVRALADRVIDSSALTAAQLRETLLTVYAGDTRPALLVTITSFGFKYGLPMDADLVFDVRFLANPHYVATLKNLDGRDPRVADYIHQDARTNLFQAKMNDLVEFALPQYQREGKVYLNIAIGCTGGKHRSVMLAEELAAQLQPSGYQIVVRHRDLLRDRPESGVGCRVSGVGEQEAEGEKGRKGEGENPMQGTGNREQGTEPITQLPNYPTTQLPDTQHPTPTPEVLP